MLRIIENQSTESLKLSCNYGTGWKMNVACCVMKSSAGHRTVVAQTALASTHSRQAQQRLPS